MTDDNIAKLRAELEGLKDAARLGPLIRLAQSLTEKYWRAGPGRPVGLPDLDEAIAALEDCHKYLRADDSLRGQVAAQLGWLLSSRYTLHTEDERDRATGSLMLSEALDSPRLNNIARTMSLVFLGQLCIGRVSRMFQEPGAAMSLVNSAVPPDTVADVDRAVDCFRQVLADESASRDLRDAVEPMLSVAEVVRTMIGGTGAAGIDLQAMMATMAKLQDLRGRFQQHGGTSQGFRGTETFFSFADMRAVMEIDPLNRPVAVVEQAEPPAAPVEPRQRAVSKAIDIGELRTALHEKLCRADTTELLWVRAAELLQSGASELAIDTVDDVVALATMVVDAGDNDPECGAVDRFVLAVALNLRDRLDEVGDRADVVAGAESLLAAVCEVPADHPAANTMLLSLGAFLEEDKQFGGALEVVAEGFADRIDAAIAAGVADPSDLAALHALRCLCRAAESVAEFRRAAVPPDYLWRSALKAAARDVG